MLGSLVMGWAALRARQLQPSWFDPGDGPACAREADGCPADLDAALTGLWWWVAAGGALALAGVVLLVHSLSTARRQEDPAHPLVHAAVVGLVGGVVGVVLVYPLLLALFFSAHAAPLGIGAAWLVQAGVVAGLDVTLGATPPRRAFLTGLAACALAFGATLLSLRWTSGPWPAAALVDGAVLALTVAVVRAASRRARPGRAAEVRAVVVCAVVLAVVVGTTAVGTGAGEFTPSTTGPSSAPTPPTDSEPEPAPTTQPSPAPVDAAEPCTMEDLTFAVGGFDAAMGARAAGLQATNTSESPCWVEGVPAVTLLQGGRPLQLTVGPGQAPSGGPAVVQRVGLAPDGSAFALLTWRTYAGWADAETPQAVTAALDPASPAVEATLTSDFGPAPFDIADGGEWEIAPWAPPWN
jgi:hypothetical protein